MLRAAVIFLWIALLPLSARAQARIALLIGNEAYGNEIGRLANPHNDVGLLEQALKGLGFEVITVHDAGLGALTRAVNAYTRRLQAAGPDAIGFFYYSGHGASDGITNYLIPVDVKATETGALWDESLRLTEITHKLKAEAGSATLFVVFDACRNTLKLTQPGSRAVVQSKGFVPVAQENGMLIAYTTAEGELASDVGAGAGPYAKALAEEIVKPGVEAVVMFRAVQRRVRATIRQEPYLGFNALGDVYLAGRSDQAEEAKRKQAEAGGHFTMGSPESEPQRESEKKGSESPQHEVMIDKAFAVGRFPVTRGEFAAFITETNHKTDGGCNTWTGVEFRWRQSDKSWRSPGFAQDDRHPVVCVNWDDAKAYAAWLSEKTGKSYRLLSEAEREYVTRAGTSTPFWWGTSITPRRANYNGGAEPYKGGGSRGEYRKRTMPVDSFEPNTWGLYQVHGNVWDWTEDCWNEDYKGAPTDGSASTWDCKFGVIRGGSWHSVPALLRSAHRYQGVSRAASNRSDNVSFRLARTLAP